MKKFAIVGAGAVGVSTCVALLHEHLASEITLYDVNFEKAEGEALDFAHVSSLFSGTVVNARRMQDLAPTDIAILTAGVKSKPGETRLQLLERNLIAADSIATQLEIKGLPKILIVVTNPVDVITEYFRRRWNEKDVVVFGSGTSLDTLRLRHELSCHFGVNAQNIHAWVVGEHGDTSVSLLSSARIGCHSLDVYSKLCDILMPNSVAVQNSIRSSAYEVIRRNGATCHAIGETTGRIVKAIVRDEKVIIPVSVGIETGVCASIPCIIGAKGPEMQISPLFNLEEREMFAKSLSILKEACSKITLPPVPGLFQFEKSKS